MNKKIVISDEEAIKHINSTSAKTGFNAMANFALHKRIIVIAIVSAVSALVCFY